jgi:hypothetical protein
MLRVAAEPACRANEVPSEAKTTNSAKANFTDFDMGESSKIKFTRNPNAGEAHLGSQSFHTNKLKFIEHSRNALAIKLPFLARLLTHSAAFGRYKRDHETRFLGFRIGPDHHRLRWSIQMSRSQALRCLTLLSRTLQHGLSGFLMRLDYLCRGP